MRRRQVRRLLRLLPAAEIPAVAPDPGDVPGRGAGRADADRRSRIASPRDPADTALSDYERRDRRRGSGSPTGAARPTGGCWTPSAGLGGPGSAGLAGHRRADPAAAVRRAGRRRGVRGQPQGPAAGRAGRRPRRPWASTPASGPG